MLFGFGTPRQEILQLGPETRRFDPEPAQVKEFVVGCAESMPEDRLVIRQPGVYRSEKPAQRVGSLDISLL